MYFERAIESWSHLELYWHWFGGTQENADWAALAMYFQMRLDFAILSTVYCKGTINWGLLKSSLMVPLGHSPLKKAKKRRRLKVLSTWKMTKKCSKKPWAAFFCLPDAKSFIWYQIATTKKPTVWSLSRFSSLTWICW